MFGRRGTPRIETCRPAQATYVPGVGCLLRYEVELGHRILKPLVSIRIFGTEIDARRYAQDRLLPLAERALGRAELEPFASPVAVLPDLNAAVSVYPIDGELPTLVDATDPARIAALLEPALGGFTVTRCRVERGHYGRQHRCVVRCELDGVMTSSGAKERRVAYGKVTDARRGALCAAALSALRECGELKSRGVRVPRVLVFDPALDLLLVEALPGAPLISRLVRGEGPETPREPTLEAAIESAAHVAAALHASGIRPDRHRDLDEDLAGLTRELWELRRLSPGLVELLGDRLQEAQRSLQGSGPLTPTLSHGDFSHTQVLFAGMRCGLVDFDTVCRAEPALDLGHFSAYLRLTSAKHRHRAADELCSRFLDAYVDAAGDRLEDGAQLRARVAGYEVVSLVRLATHSWRKFKPSRLAHVLGLLEERVSCLP